ncbi:FMN-binding negative transcriptional regulator [Gracilimonas sp.]|uniref:FMN-binding negative transcriptional regulator n=1 Tax=Gracilimonas sp. TaxID=1974203 RepID=UPI0032EB2EAE
MYNPNSFKETDPNILYPFIEEHNFGLIFSQTESTPEATHLPFMVNRNDDILIGHFARANKHWQHINEKAEVLIVFQGTHGYISPSWYKNQNTVPTWNYAAVHVYGTPTIVHNIDELREMVDSLTYHHEEGVNSDWDYEAAHSKRERLLRGIVGIRINITKLEGKFKFNQNRSIEDQKKVIKTLENSASESNRKMASIMKRNLK